MAKFLSISLQLFVKQKPWNCEEWVLSIVHEEDDDNDEVLADKQDLIYKKNIPHSKIWSQAAVYYYSS